MDAEYFIFDDSCETQVIENVRAVPPDVERTVFPEAFVVESVDLGNLPRLMVSSDACSSGGGDVGLQCDTVWVTNFECQKEQERFDAVEPAVDEVAKKQVIGVGAVTTNFEELHQIEKLAVDVSANLLFTIREINLP